jgi:hypothetical protein
MRDIGMPEIITICGVLVLFGFALVLVTGALRVRQSRSVQKALIDKLAVGNELSAFLQTPAGEQFVRDIAEVESPARSIITAMQRGIVVIAVGMGALMLGGSVPLAVRAVGLLLVCLGVGLLIAAFASYLVARRWQLLGRDANLRAK